MALKLKNPITFMDIEATGMHIPKDHIIDIACIQLLPDGSDSRKSWRLNPTVPIPPETTAIHGIKDEDVEDAPTFKQVGYDIARFLEGSDLAGFAIIKFDLPILMEEFLRADIKFNIDKRRIVDAQKIFHLMEKRNLATAYRFYCNQELINAHSAMADTEASVQVLLAQIKKYDQQKVVDMQGNNLGTISGDVEALHEITTSEMIDLAGRMIVKEGLACFNFGKHKGKQVLSVLKKEPSYYDWIMNGEFPLDTKRKLTEIKLKSKY